MTTRPGGAKSAQPGVSTPGTGPPPSSKPRQGRDSLREIHDLPPADRAALIEEIAQASKVLTRLFHPDKLDVGALGNRVPQLHLHVVARTTTDSAWPGPVWGSGVAVAYEEGELEEMRGRIAGELSSG